VKLPSWIEASGPIATENGKAVVVVRVRTDRRAFWAEMLRTGWREYGAFWWHPGFWRVMVRYAWQYVRAAK